MGAAIIGGLLAKGSTTASNIIVSDPFEGTRQKLSSTLGVRTTTSNNEASQDADILLLAVKPQVAKSVCEDLAAAWSEEKREKLPLVVSICAGLPLDALTKWLEVEDGRKPKVVRVMPNTPAMLGEGAAGSFAGSGVDEGEKRLVGELLEGFSKVSEWVDREELIDVVTALSGTFPPSNIQLQACLRDIQDRDQLTSLLWLSTWCLVLQPWACHGSRRRDLRSRLVLVLGGCSSRLLSLPDSCALMSLVLRERLRRL